MALRSTHAVASARYSCGAKSIGCERPSWPRTYIPPFAMSISEQSAAIHPLTSVVASLRSAVEQHLVRSRVHGAEAAGQLQQLPGLWWHRVHAVMLPSRVAKRKVMSVPLRFPSAGPARLNGGATSPGQPRVPTCGRHSGGERNCSWLEGSAEGRKE